MENPNAFIGKAKLPTIEEVAAALGPAAKVWHELVDWFAGQKVVDQEWNSYSPKAGWALRLKYRLSLSLRGLLPRCLHLRR
jgi:hypothetical protein